MRTRLETVKHWGKKKFICYSTLIGESQFFIQRYYMSHLWASLGAEKIGDRLFWMEAGHILYSHLLFAAV